MKSALENLSELNEVSNNHPRVLPLIGAVLELEEKFRSLEDSKQDKPSAITAEVNPNDLTRGALQQKLHRALSAAADKEQEVALKIHSFLSSLE
jgi:hypothetical protein